MTKEEERKKQTAATVTVADLEALGLKPIDFSPPTKNPKNRIVTTKRDIRALRKYLARKQWLEKETFPKIRLFCGESNSFFFNLKVFYSLMMKIANKWRFFYLIKDRLDLIWQFFIIFLNSPLLFQ